MKRRADKLRKGQINEGMNSYLIEHSAIIATVLRSQLSPIAGLVGCAQKLALENFLDGDVNEASTWSVIVR